jgi:protein SCO1/2
MWLCRRALLRASAMTALCVAGVALPSGAVALPVGEAAPAFELANWDGRRVSSESLKGNRALLAFTYAKCVRACPMLTYQLRGLDRDLGRPADVRYVHISVNPSEDTPEEIIEHFRKHDIDPRADGRWLFLSGDEGEVADVLEAFDVEVTLTPVEGGNLVEHTIVVFVVNAEGKVVAEFDTYHWDEKEMHGALETKSQQQ